MKNVFLVFSLLLISLCLIAEDFQQPAYQAKEIPCRASRSINSTRETPEVDFVTAPVDLFETYYDYMPGSYNCNPIILQPETTSTGMPAGGLYVAFHATQSASATAQRRVYFAYINDEGNLQTISTITDNNVREGYSGIDVDPGTGDPIAAWHNVVETDNTYDCSMSYDIYHIIGGPGAWATSFIAIDNPEDSQPYTGHDDDEFIWPKVKIGPSPIEGKRRVYIYGDNYTSNSSGVANYNMLVGNADFDGNDLLAQTPLDFEYFTFPDLDYLHYNDVARAIKDIAVSDDGQIAFVGWYGKTFFVEYSDDFGETFTYMEKETSYDLLNPQNEDGTYYFENESTGEPEYIFAYPSSDGGHFNAFFSGDNSRIVAMSAFGINSYSNFDEGIYMPAMFYPKIYNYTISNGQLDVDVIDLYIEGADPNDDQPMIPWDLDEDGIVDTFTEDGNVGLISSVPSFFYNGDAQDAFFHESNFKLSVNGNWMVAVWQDAENVYHNYYEEPGYEDWADSPEIAIATSTDGGVHWSQPAFINAKVGDANYHSELNGMIPEYVYPADKLEIIDDTHAKLHLFFLDDHSYGSYTQGHGSNIGGMLQYAAVSVEMSGASPADDTIYDIQYTTNAGDGTYPSPMTDQEVTVQGIVTGAGYAGEKFFICDLPEYGTGAWHGIYVYNTDPEQAPEIGDLVEVTGTVSEYYGVTEIGFATVNILSSGLAVPGPTLVSTLDLVAPDFAEQYEGCFVAVSNVEVTEAQNEYGEWYIDDGTGECQVDDGFFYLDEIDPPIVITEGDTFGMIKGILDYSYDLYGLNPRIPSDICESVEAFYGDIDDNNIVQVFDASSTLMYAVGLDPIPDIDPRPWESLRITAADVDGNLAIQAYDASLILQYAVGLIDHFPVENKEAYIAKSSDVSIQTENGYLLFTAGEDLLGFELSIDTGNGISFGQPEFLADEIISTTNLDNGVYSLAICSANAISDNNPFMRIPFDVNSYNATDLLLHLTINTEEKDVLIDLSNLGEDSPELVTFDHVSNNYPNPFNPETSIQLAVKENNTSVSMKIYNVKGQLIKTLLSGHLNSGYHDVIWNGKDNNDKFVSSGVYFYKIEIGKNQFMNRMILMK